MQPTQGACNILYSFRVWKNQRLIAQAQAHAAELKREKDELELRYQEEIKRLEQASKFDLELEREQFSLSITYTTLHCNFFNHTDACSLQRHCRTTKR
jgi:hypothetical protein